MHAKSTYIFNIYDVRAVTNLSGCPQTKQFWLLSLMRSRTLDDVIFEASSYQYFTRDVYVINITVYVHLIHGMWYIICDRRISAFGEPQRLSYVAHGLWNRFRWSWYVRIRSGSFIIWVGPWKGAHSYGLLHMCWQINLITRSSTKNVSKFARVWYMDEKK